MLIFFVISLLFLRFPRINGQPDGKDGNGIDQVKIQRIDHNVNAVNNRMLREFAPELTRVKVDTLTHYNDGTLHIQRLRSIP